MIYLIDGFLEYRTPPSLDGIRLRISFDCFGRRVHCGIHDNWRPYFHIFTPKARLQ